VRKFFFLSILIGGALAGIVYYLWLVVSALYRDWLMGRDVEQIQAESAARREQRRLEAARRLDTGCDHRFGEAFAGLPPNACHKCGLEQTRPPGPCDHVWTLVPDAVPYSYCAKCGKRYVSADVGGQ
jgi:hypothetical protein